MRELIKSLLDQDLSRRDFAKSMVALGFSATAIQSVLSSVVNAATVSGQESLEMVGSGGEVFAECLKAAGVEYVFDTNSTGQTSFYDACSTRPELNLIVALQEGQATSMAQGYELASGRTAVLFLPSIGIPNSLSNLYNAWKDRSALVVFTDGSDTETAGRDGFQQVDNWLQPTEQFTKWRWEINHPERISEIVRRGIKLAGTPPGGPVYVRMPRNVLAAQELEQTIYPQSNFEVPLQLAPRADAIEQATRLLLEAENPLINVGGEVTRAGANADVLELAELLSIRFAQGYSVFGDVPFRHPLFAGSTSMGFPSGFRQTDVFLNLGAPMPDPSIITAPVSADAKVINVRVEYDKIANIYPTDLAIAAGQKETIRALIDSIKATATKSQIRKLSSERLPKAEENYTASRQRQERRAQRMWDNVPLATERLCYEMDQALADNAIVFKETGDGTPRVWMNFGPDQKQLIGQTTGYALGWSCGAAMGAKIAQPDRQVVSLVGDGAMLFGQLESLWTASRYDIPITIVVFNNRSYDSERGRIHLFSQIARKDKAAWKDMSCYLGSPDIDYVSIAKGFEIDAIQISRPEEVEPAIQRAAAVNREGRPFLIDAVIARRGPGAESTWYPEISIAARRSQPV